MRHQSSKAFTLVELLVVIGIIALLISILLPALNKARGASKLVTCGSQMRQIAIGLINYANDNKGFLPTSEGYPTTPANAPGSFTTNATFNTNIESTSKPPVGLGLLVKTKYSSRKILICPGQADGSVFFDRSNYLYNPHPAVVQGQSGWDKTGGTVRWKKLTQIPADRCLVMDIIYNGATLCHWEPTLRTSTWNLAFRDGHVVAVKSADLAQNIVGRNGTGGHWTRLNDWVRYPEMLAAGLDPGRPIPFGGDRLYPVATVPDWQ